MSDLPLRAAMAWYGVRLWRPLDTAAARPGDAQAAVLRRILSAHHDTTFGRSHGFADIRSHEDYCRHVPVQQYEDLRPLIDRQRTTGESVLTRDAPLFYAQTSGTTGTPKYLPITPTVLAVNRAEQRIFSFLQHRACPTAFTGRMFGIMGAAVEGRLESGHVVGSVSGHLYQSLPRLMQARFAVPPEVSAVADYEQKYLLMLRLALEAPDITYMGSPNPSSFLRLGVLMERHREMLTRSLASGAFEGLDALDPRVRVALRGRITAQPARAAALERLPALTFSSVWPRLALVTTWTGGSCGIALDALRPMLPVHTRVMELGYQSTEFRGTMALDAGTPAGLPPLTHTFFEFVEEDRWVDASPECLTLDRLREGPRYQVVVTTGGGLYRYFMNDLVEVAGAYRGTPLLKFVQKGRGVTSLTGEKLYEAQVIDAVQQVTRAHGVMASFYLMAADEAAHGYMLFIEASAEGVKCGDRCGPALDAALGERNLEFKSKRDSGRLAPTRIVWLRVGAAEAYKAACVAAGQREGQYKPAVLQYARDLKLTPAALLALRYEG